MSISRSLAPVQLPMRSNQQIRINRLMLREVYGYQPMQLRPYQSTGNPGAVTELANRLSDTPNATVTPANLGAIANEIVAPSTVSTGEAHIKNGWGETRLRFLLDVSFVSGLGETRELVMGYTDWAGFGHVMNNQASLAPEMVFHINSITKLRELQEQTPMGTRTNVSLASSNHILSDPNMGMGHESLYNLRSENVFGTIVNGSYSSGNVYMASDRLGTFPLACNRKEAATTTYLSSMLSSVQRAARQTDFSEIRPSNEDLMMSARGLQGYSSLSDYNFMRVIMNLHEVYSSMFTWADLCRLDPTIEHSDRVVIHRAGNALQMFSNADANHFVGSDYETMAATIIGNSVPSILMETACNHLHFKASNKTLNSELVLTLIGGSGFGNMDISPYIDTIFSRIKVEVLDALSMGGNVPLEVEVNCDIQGDTVVIVQVNGGYATPYVIPTFCDALFSPVLTTNPNDLGAIAHDLSYMFDYFIDHAPNSGPDTVTTYPEVQIQVAYGF